MTNKKASYAGGALVIEPGIVLDEGSPLHPGQWKGEMLVRTVAAKDGTIVRVEPNFPGDGLVYYLMDALLCQLGTFARAYPEHAITGEIDYYDDFGTLPWRLTVRRTEQGNRAILTPGYHVLNGGWRWPDAEDWGLEVRVDGSVPEPPRRWED